MLVIFRLVIFLANQHTVFRQVHAARAKPRLPEIKYAKLRRNHYSCKLDSIRAVRLFTVLDFIMPCLDRIVRNNMGEKSKVRRCLFGSPDHESLRKDLDEQLKRTRSDMTSTWNFDADTDKPLVGRYEWTLIKQDEDLSVPSYYFKGYRPTKFRKVIRERSSDSVSSQVTPFVSRISLDDSQEDLQRENETTPELRPSQRQSRIDGKHSLFSFFSIFSGLMR